MEVSTRSAAVGPTWFAVAVQALAKLANDEGVCPSTAIACEVRTHAVFLRRILAQLARAGIVAAREGRDGGYHLARPAEQITLADVYRALNAPSPIAVSAEPFDASCPGNLGMQMALGEVRLHAESQIVEVLGQYTIAGVLARAEQVRSAV